jgi:beta-galactosidase
MTAILICHFTKKGGMMGAKSLKTRAGASVVLIVAMAMLTFGQPTTLPTTEVRQNVCLNGIWNFTPDGGSATTIQVPATWDRNTNATYTLETNFHNSFPQYLSSWTGGTYGRSLAIPASMNTGSMVIKLAFGSVRFSSQVSVNGTQVAADTDGFLPFECKINSNLITANTVTVHVNANATVPSGLSSDYAWNRGIWQDVYLKAYPLVYVDNTFFVRTSYRNNRITTNVPVRNEDTRSRTFYIRNFVTDATGAIVLMFDSGVQTLAAGGSQTYTFGAAWTNPRYWIPEDPYLYTIHTVIYDSDQTTVVDWKKTRFGFKEFWASGTQLLLNGKRAFLRGDSHHYHSEYQQTKAYFIALFKSMKEWGCNYYRPHTLPFDPVMYDVADSLGMMIIAETAIYGSDGDDAGVYPNHVRRLVERDRNHPSVILWSSSNEVQHMGTNPEPNRAVAAQADSTRIAYAEENHYENPEVCSYHYFDYTHTGLYPTTLPGVPVVNAAKAHIMGEYSHPQIIAFGDSGTSACGYECKSQDYGTGYFTHGETALGQTQALQNQRLYAGYCSWCIHFYACRCQPFFNNDSIVMSWPDLTAPGAKPSHIRANEFTINWADTSLPTYVPLPWFYHYVPLYQAIRFTDLMPVYSTGYPPINNCNYYAGTTITRSCNLWYESFQNANHMRAEIVRKSDNAVLSSNDLTAAPWNNIQAGNTYTGLTVTWTAPAVTDQTPVYINRTFYTGTTKQSTVSYEGNIFPRFTASHVPGLAGKRVALFDPAGTTKTILDNIGLTYTSVTALSSVTAASYDVLIIGANNPTTGLDANFAISGGRVLCLSQTAKPSLPINLPALIAGAQKDVQFLLNGAKHKILEGLNQNDLSYWANSVNTAQNVYDRPTANENIRVLLAANNNGDYAPILEVPVGRGTYLLSQMEIVPQYSNEPVAGKLLVNMLNYLGYYTATTITKTGLIADAGAVKTYYDGLQLRYDALTASGLPADLTPYVSLIIDGSSTSIAASLSSAATITKLNAYVNGGGKVMINQITSGTIAAYSQIMGQFSLMLTTPAEKNRSVKCAVSWLKKNSPKEIVRYGYLNIPSAFEMNPDPLLLGISNKDLDWTATQVNNGVKVSGKAYPDVNVLIAPYRIDWVTLKSAYDKYTSPMFRAKSQADWFKGRDPVLLKLKQGSGYWLINEILLQNDAVKGRRVGNLLLTSFGASVVSDMYLNNNVVVSIKGDGYQAIAKENGMVNLLGVYSNPATKAVKIIYTLPGNYREIKKVSFSFFSISGKQVIKEVCSAGYHAGKNEMQFNDTKIFPTLSRGVYILKMSIIHKNQKQQNFFRQLSVF